MNRANEIPNMYTNAPSLEELRKEYDRVQQRLNEMGDLVENDPSLVDGLLHEFEDLLRRDNIFSEKISTHTAKNVNLNFNAETSEKEPEVSTNEDHVEITRGKVNTTVPTAPMGSHENGGNVKGAERMEQSNMQQPIAEPHHASITHVIDILDPGKHDPENHFLGIYPERGKHEDGLDPPTTAVEHGVGLTTMKDEEGGQPSILALDTDAVTSIGRNENGELHTYCQCLTSPTNLDAEETVLDNHNNSDENDPQETGLLYGDAIFSETKEAEGSEVRFDDEETPKLVDECDCYSDEVPPLEAVPGFTKPICVSGLCVK